MRCRTSNRHVAIRVTSYIESIISAIFATRKLVAILVWFTTACTGMRQKMTESSSFEFACDSIAIVGKSPACCSSFAFNDSAVLREQQDNRTKSYRNCKWRTVTAAVSQRVVDDRLISFLVHQLWRTPSIQVKNNSEVWKCPECIKCHAATALFTMQTC